MTNATVGISDMKILKNEGTLITYALGSCIGICVYDETNKGGTAGRGWRSHPRRGRSRARRGSEARILSLSPLYTGIREYFSSINSSIYSSGESFISIENTSVRGVIIS